MPYSPWQQFIVDAKGNILANAQVDVYLESNGARATLYSDAAGSGLGNPFNADGNGLARFYAAAGRYRIVATHGVYTAEFRNEQVGDAQGYDVGDDADGKLLTRAQLDGRYNLKIKDTSAARAPTTSDNGTAGYSQGSRWFDTSVSPTEAYICADPGSGSPELASWVKTSLTLDELGSMATKDAGTGGSQFRTNNQNDERFYPLAANMVEIAGTTYTLQASDNGKVLVTTNASAVTITIPDGLTDFQCGIWRYGDGKVTVQAGSGATVNAPEGLLTIETKYAMGTVVAKASGEYGFFGGLEPITPADIGAAAALSGYGSPTGTADRTAWSTYDAPAISSPPTKAEVQAIADSLQTVSRHMKAMQEDLD